MEYVKKALGDCEDHPYKILMSAVAKYSKWDPIYCAVDAEAWLLCCKIKTQHPSLEQALDEFGGNADE